MKRLAPALLLLGVVAAVYLNSFRGVFQFDDYNVIVGNPTVHSWGALLADLRRGIRPLLKFTYALNWTSGLGLFGFHLVNVALHAGNAVLLLLVARRIGGVSGSGFTALFAALLFAVHPAQTEAVTYISGRSVSLMGFLYLASVLAYLRGRDRESRLWLHIVSPLLFLFAVLAKETAFTLPVALALCEVARNGRTGWRRALGAQAVHWALLGGLVFFVLAHPGYGRLLENCFDIRGASTNLLTQVHGILHLLSRLVLPHALNIDPDLPVVSGWTPLTGLAALFLGLLLAAGACGVKRGGLAGFGILWFFLHLVPTNSFIPRLDVANDRQLYLASWGVFLALASGADHLRNRAEGRWVPAAAVFLVVLLGGFTVARNEVYRSEIALWEDTAGKSPGKARVHNNLGYAYEKDGRLREAGEAYLRALAIDPGHKRARVNLEGVIAKERERGWPSPGPR